MILNHRFFGDEYSDTIISLRNLPLQNSTDFKYLGLYISQNEPNTRDIEVNYRIQMTYANLPPWSTSFKTLRFTLKPESSFLILFSAANSRTQVKIGIELWVSLKN